MSDDLEQFHAEQLANMEQTNRQMTERLAESDQSLAEFHAEVLAQGQKVLTRLMETLQADVVTKNDPDSSATPQV
jgi:hypothetical protein